MFSRLVLNLRCSCLILRGWNYTSALPFLKARVLETQRLHWLPCGISILFDRLRQGSLLSGAYATCSGHRTQATVPSITNPSSLSISTWWVQFKKTREMPRDCMPRDCNHKESPGRWLIFKMLFFGNFLYVSNVFRLYLPTLPILPQNFSWMASHISLLTS